MPILNGSSYASYVVRLSRAASTVLTIPWRTEAGTAEPGEDYEHTVGSVSFAPGETEKTIQVLVYGRAAGDTEARNFLIRLTPTPGVVLAAETASAIIEVVNEDGLTIASVTFATGPTGKSAYEIARVQGFEGTAAEWIASLKGEVGDDGPSAYAIAVSLGFEGNQTQWLASLKGETGEGSSAYDVAVEDGFEGTEAEWLESLRGLKGNNGDSAYDVAVEEGFEGTEDDWLASLKGDDGIPIEIQRGTTHVQWRYVGDTAWTNLVALADIKGEAGTGLNNRGDWEAATYEPGDYVFAAGSTAAMSMWILRGDVDYVSADEPAEDLTHWIEFEAPAGPPGEDGSDGDNGDDGRAVEFQKSATHIQWRYVGDTGWTSLVALADLAGSPGAAGSKWIVGAGAPAAATGTQGDFYLNSTNSDVYGPKGASTWGAVAGNIKGAAGAAGAKWLVGAGVPAAATGAQGDFYLNSTTSDVYGPKGASAWGSIAANIKGAAGSGGGGSSGIVALRSADLGVTETTLVNALSFTCVANTVYDVNIQLLFRTTDVSKGVRVGFGGTAGVQSLAAKIDSFDSAGAPVSKFCKARATPNIFATSAFGGDDNILTVRGTLFVTGAGTFTFQIGAAVQYDYTAAQKGTFGTLTPVGTIAE